MKKTLKNILISITTIYLILSVIYMIFNIGLTQENIEISKQKKAEFYNNVEISINDVTQNYWQGMRHVSYYNLGFLITAGVLGTLIGCIISAKENSIAKHISYFILGNFIYTFIWMCIENLYFKAYGLIGADRIYLSDCVNAFKRYFLSYIFVYAVLMIARIILNKYKVKILNQNLDKPQKQVDSNIHKFHIGKKEKKILIRIGIFLVIVMVLIAGMVIARKSMILINYAKKINEIDNSDNFSLTIERYREEAENIKQQEIVVLYHRDNKNVWKNKGQENRYEDRQNNELMYIDEASKTIHKYDTTRMLDGWREINNVFYIDTYVRTWANILLSFDISIRTEKVDGVDCYVLKNNYIELYINKDTYEPVQEKSVTEYGTEEKLTYITKYQYQYGNVTQEDVKLPDITNYTMIEEKQ